jgi:hypothetical protein
MKILEVRNSMDGHTSGFLVIGFLLVKQSDKMNLIESMPTASLKVVHLVLSNCIQALLALLGRPSSLNFSEKLQRPFGSPSHRGGPSETTVQLSTLHPAPPKPVLAPGPYPDSQTFADADHGNNMNDLNETDDDTQVPHIF